MSIFARFLCLSILGAICFDGSTCLKVADLKSMYNISESSPVGSLFPICIKLDDIPSVEYTLKVSLVVSEKRYKDACALFNFYITEGSLCLKLVKKADYEMDSNRICVGNIIIEACFLGRENSAPDSSNWVSQLWGNQPCFNPFEHTVTLKIIDESSTSTTSSAPKYRTPPMKFL